MNKLKFIYATILVSILTISSFFIIDILFSSKMTSLPLWSYETGGALNAVDVSSDGKYIVAGSKDNNIYFFNNTSANPIWTFSADADINDVAISSDGNYIVAGSQDHKIYFFNKSSAIPIYSYETGGSVSAVVISSNGTYFVAGSQHVFLFNKSSSIPMRIYQNIGGIKKDALKMSFNGDYIITGMGGTIFLLNKSSSIPMWNYTTYDSIKSVALSYDGGTIIAGSSMEGNLYLFNKSSSIPIWNYHVGNSLMNIDITADGKYIAVAGARIFMFENSSSTPIWITEEDYIYADSIKFSNDGKYLVMSTTFMPSVYLFETLNSKYIWKFSKDPGSSSLTSSVAISEFGKHIVMGLGYSFYSFDKDNIQIFHNIYDYINRFMYLAIIDIPCIVILTIVYLIITKRSPRGKIKSSLKNVEITRGGEWVIEENMSIFYYKVKINNLSQFVISNLQIIITSIPPGLKLISDKLINFSDLNIDSFVSPSFKFAATENCVGNRIEAIVTFRDFNGMIHTIQVVPFNITYVCNLLVPKQISDEEFEEKVAFMEEKKLNFKCNLSPDELERELEQILKNNNFYLLNKELEPVESNIRKLKGYATGRYDKKDVALLFMMQKIAERNSNLAIKVMSDREEKIIDILKDINNKCEGIKAKDELNVPIDIRCEKCGNVMFISDVISHQKIIFCEKCGEEIKLN